MSGIKVEFDGNKMTYAIDDDVTLSQLRWAVLSLTEDMEHRKAIEDGLITRDFYDPIAIGAFWRLKESGWKPTW